LDHGAHRAVEHDDALVQQLFQWVNLVQHAGEELSAVYANIKEQIYAS
jgi:hypothetical protein